MVGDVLTQDRSLTALYLSWNNIRAEGAAWIAEGMSKNEHLQILSLALNPIGSALKPGKSLKTATSLRDMFATNKALLHIDLSYCDLGKDECFKMNEGLLLNHTILGLHMSGNQLDTDPNGFITEDKS